MTDNEKEEWKSVKYRINEEGMDYCFLHYSHWQDVKDEEFHRLRNNYIDATKELKSYIEKKSAK